MSSSGKCGVCLSLTWLGSLSDLDLQLISIHHELGCHAKSAGRDLLDAGGDGVTLLQPLQVGEGGGQAFLVHISQMLPAERVFTALARIALACTIYQIKCHLLAVASLVSSREMSSELEAE